MNVFQMMFMAAGGSGVVLNLNAHNVLDDITPSGSASANISFQSNGQVTFTGNNSPPSPDTDEWDSNQPNGDGALYEVALTQVVSGDSPDVGPSVGVYSPLSSPVGWSVSVTNDTHSGVWKIRVREIADPGGNFVEANQTVTARVLP